MNAADETSATGKNARIENARSLLTRFKAGEKCEAKERAKGNIVRSVRFGGATAISDNTMRWLFGTSDPALTSQQQFQQDFVGEKPDAAANRARRAFCTQHRLKAKQDKETGYWTFTTAG